MAQFFDFLIEFGENGRCLTPVKADTRRTALQFNGARQTGQGGGHIVQQAGFLICRFFRPLARFNVFPVGFDGIRAGNLNVAKHMRVSAFHFVGDGRRHIEKIEMSRFLRHLRVEHHLQQQITQFILERCHVAGFNGVCHLVSLFNRVGHNRREGLLNIPRATSFGVAQGSHNIQNTDQLGGIGHGVCPPWNGDAYKF